MRKGTLFTLAAIFAVGLFVLLAGKVWLTEYTRDLDKWRSETQHLPEGEAARLLFARATKAGVISWDGQVRGLVLKRERAFGTPLYDEFFRLGETGTVIQGELSMIGNLQNMVAVRVRDPRCARNCKRQPLWQAQVSLAASLPPSRADAKAMEMAQAASGLRTLRMPPPSPRTHYPLWRQAGVGYSPWISWHRKARFQLSGQGLGAFDQIDVVGRLGFVPTGWTAKLFCRDGRGLLRECTESTGIENSDGARLSRASFQTEVTLDLTPLPPMPRSPGPGEWHLSERVKLDCRPSGQVPGRGADSAEDVGALCVPRWQPLRSPRLYARGAAPERPTPDAADEAAEHTSGGGKTPLTSRQEKIRAFLGVWAEVDPENRLVGSSLARSTRAQAITGGDAPRYGTLIRALDDLPSFQGLRFTLESNVQKVLADVVSDVPQRDDSLLFKNLIYSFPEGIPRISVVVLDLRDDENLGAVLGAVGLPDPPPGLSPWDEAAAMFDPDVDFATGSPAWTGRRWYHTPGSTWKLLTSLAMIDALERNSVDPATRRAIDQALGGLTRDQSDAVLGSRALWGQGGLCLPLRRGLLAQGSTNGSCPSEEFVRKPIGDSGFGGPLRNNASARYGLTLALKKSSNIWFTAVNLRAEQGKKPDDPPLVAQTAERLGLLQPQALDGARGLDSLTKADAVLIEALSIPDDFPVLAQASFGQRVQAGPLVLAQLAAMVATNRIVRPSLIAPVGRVPRLFETSSGRTQLRKVHEGMKAVVSDARNTAFGAGTANLVFRERAREIMPRVFGKTGTAQTGRGDARVSTFAGWVNNQDKPAFAIGCSVAVNLRNDRKVTPLCAHISAEIIKVLVTLEMFQ